MGSADEGDHEAGAAHFLEHMLFKGTRRREVGEVAATIEGLGGDLNAYTSFDETCFHATVEADAWREALDVLVDMTRNSRLDADELERERQVILDEIAGYADDPDSVASDRLNELLFASHPYARPVLGTIHSVRHLSRDTLLGFWRRHYHPGRALLVVSGPVDEAAVRAELAPQLAGWPLGAERQGLEAVRPAAEPALARPPGGFEGRAVHLGWGGYPIGHPDLPALEVLAAALGQGGASLLPSRLELEEGVASRSWAQTSSYRGGGSLEVGFQPGDTREALALTLEAIEGVRRRGLDGDAVYRAREGLLVDQLFTTETVEGRASERVWATLYRGGPDALDDDHRALAAVTADDVARVAKEVLAPTSRQVVVLDREVPEASLREVLQAKRSRPVHRRAAPGVPWVGEVAGIRLALLPDGGRLAAARVLWPGGQLVESSRAAGSARAWSEVVTRGAAERPAQAFAERVDALAAWLDASSGRSTQGLSLSLPADRLGHGLELVGDALLDPHFDAVDVEHVVDDLLDDVSTRRDRPAQAATEALWAALFPGHPWRLPPGGTEATMSRVTPAGLRRLHERVVRQGRLTMAVTGSFDPDDVVAFVEGLGAELPDATPRATVPALRPVGRPRSERAGTTQAAVVAGVRVEPCDPERRLALQVAAHLLDSQSGRLFLQLREATGLAYSVWATSEVAPEGGAFQVGLTCAPERAEEGAAGLRRVFDELAQHGPTEAELSRVVRMLRGMVSMRRQRVVGRATDLAWSVFLDRPYDLDALRARLASLTTSQVHVALGELVDELQVAVASPR